MQPKPAFWDNIAVKYRKTPITDQAAYDYTLERTASYLRAEDHVLEIGCGTGGTAAKLAPFASDILATDFSDGMIAQARARETADTVRFAATTVFDESFTKGQFNAVLAFNLFHLVADFRAHVERIHDLLVPGGLFISKTPSLTDPSAAFKYRMMVKVIPLMQFVGKAPFVKFRTIADTHATLQECGFEIQETGNYPAQPPNHFVVARKL